MLVAIVRTRVTNIIATNETFRNNLKSKNKMKKTITILIFCSAGLGITAQNVYIPDAVFKAHLVGNLSINTNSDTAIQVSEAVAFTNFISVNNLLIADMTGIEAFVNITGLLCYNNNITNLNISANTALTYINCAGNNLTSLDVTHNTSLTYLDFSRNYIPGINLSANTLLVNLYCQQNDLTVLDVSANTAITQLWCGYNNITSLNLAANTGLQVLKCEFTQLTSLDLSANISLSQFNCSDDSLTTLNVRNGNNIFMSTSYFNALHNQLTCIQVDSVAYSITNWTSDVDAGVNFNTNCSSTVSITETTSIMNITIYPNPATSTFTISSEGKKIEEIKVMNVLGEIIYQTTPDNQQTTIDVSRYSKGIYYVHTTDNHRNTTNKKIIIQ